MVRLFNIRKQKLTYQYKVWEDKMNQNYVIRKRVLVAKGKIFLASNSRT